MEPLVGARSSRARRCQVVLIFETRILIVDSHGYTGRTFVSGLVVASTFGTTMNAVISAENANINELAERTAFRAEETPVMRDATTKTFSGTRNSANSCKDGKT